MQMASVSKKFLPDNFANPSKNHSDSFDFAEAINSLNKWQHKLEILVKEVDLHGRESLKASEIDQSNLACWLRGPGKETFGGTHNFYLLEISHLSFCHIVKNIIFKAQSGDIGSASALLKGEFPLSTRLLQASIIEMNSTVGRGR